MPDNDERTTCRLTIWSVVSKMRGESTTRLCFFFFFTDSAQSNCHLSDAILRDWWADVQVNYSIQETEPNLRRGRGGRVAFSQHYGIDLS